MIQQVLEESCFAFAKKWLPSVLQKRGWDCAAVCELTKWLPMLRKHVKRLPSGHIAVEG